MQHSRWSALAVLVLLAACGGGGQSSSDAEGRSKPLAASDTAAPAIAVSEVPAIADHKATPSSAEPRTAAIAGANGAERSTGLYIVEMAQKPVTAYTGGVAGYKPTKASQGNKINPADPDVVKYGNYLAGRHDAKAQGVGASKTYSYRYVFNGFAAAMTEEQAAKLRADPEVLAVTKDTLQKPDTVSTPTFLGLNAPGGLWSVLSGNADGNPITPRGPNSAGAGEGVVVGIVDSGIWPEHPSFSDRDANGQRVFQQIPGWHGRCVPGEAYKASDCNQKLISARWYNAGFGGDAAIKAQFPYEFASARAAGSHGVHTASTAAGNYGVAAEVNGIGLGTVSGMAPRARVAVYKTCWGRGQDGGCAGADNVAAIDQAVADGVDVINYSISGSSTNFRDPVEIAFLYAAEAGVFVAASAGNSGPTASTVAHPSPWITTVAASTHDRFYGATLTLGNGATYSGASLASAVGPAPIVTSDASGLAGQTATAVALCFPGSLDPAKVTGKIVVCDRGVNARTEKSATVKAAGGIGMVLVNTSENSLNADLHSVPTIHLSHLDRPAVRAYAATAGATASINQGVPMAGLVTAPLMASFSSRGPLLAAGGDLLKPDVTAPGVDILAGASPVETGGPLFEFLSGTSMSSPHVAGLAALLKQKFPTWSPMAIKSALMTTAYQTTRTGATGQVFGNVFSFGAGHVDPNKALNPGVVFDSGFNDWLGFLCGTQLPTTFCTGAGVPVLDPSNLNVPSIAIGDMAGMQTVTRRLTNVSGQRATFTAASSGLTGTTVAVSPASFTLNPGQTQTVSVKFTRTTAALNGYAQGDIVWTSDAGHRARIPTVIRPVALAAPASVSSTGGAVSFDVTFGYTGPFSAALRGLVPAVITSNTVTQDPDQTFTAGDPTGTVAIQVTIPAGTTYARFSLFDADVAAGSDIDLYVYAGANLVGSSGNGTSAEEVSLRNPAAGTYTVYVHGWGLPSGSSPFKLHVWTLGSADAGNATLTAPTAATLGTTATVTVTPSPALAPGRYLGSVAYAGSTGLPQPTVVRVDK